MRPYVAARRQRRPAAGARRRDQRQPAVHAGRGRDRPERGRRGAGGRAPALRPVRAAQGAGLAHRLRHGAARGDAHQGRRHAADRHRLVLGRAGACADPAPHEERATSGRCSTSSACRCRPDARARPRSRRASTAARRCWSTGSWRCMRAGILRRRVSGADGREAILHAGFFVGNQAFYRELREMPRETLDLIAMTGISFTNTLAGDEAAKRAQRRDARFVNTAMVATLLGAVSSDQLEDGRVVSGAGGQHDLVAMAHALDGARSIIGLRSTRRQQPPHRLQHRLALRQCDGAATAARHRRHRVRHRRPARQIRPRRHRRDAGGRRRRFPAGPDRGGAAAPASSSASFELRRRGEQSAGEDRGGAGAGAARRPAACISARHRDDGGRAGAGRPADVSEVGGLRRSGAHAVGGSGARAHGAGAIRARAAVARPAGTMREHALRALVLGALRLQRVRRVSRLRCAYERH